MKYLCLIYGDEQRWAGVPADERERLAAEFGAFNDYIRNSEHYLGSNRLQPTAAALTVRIRDGRVSATDGPFAETKEQLGGYYLVEADSIEQAAEIAARCPGARWGSVEVRPVAEAA